MRLLAFFVFGFVVAFVILTDAYFLVFDYIARSLSRSSARARFRFLTLTLSLNLSRSAYISTRRSIRRHSPGDWEEVYVENTPDTPYYVHRTTKETTWTKPEYLAWTRVEHEYEDPVVEDEDESGERGETKEGGSAGKKKGGWFSK
jgi:hypothetical protein